MNGFESRVFVVIDGAEVPLVSRADVSCGILEHDVGDLKEFQRQRQVLIRLDGLQKAG